MGAFDFSEITVKRSEWPVSRLLRNRDHQAVGESNGRMSPELFHSRRHDLGILDGEVLVIQQHLDGRRDVFGRPLINRREDPGRFGNGEVRNPRPTRDEWFGDRGLARIVASEQPNEHVGINGSHDVF